MDVKVALTPLHRIFLTYHCDSSIIIIIIIVMITIIIIIIIIIIIKIIKIMGVLKAKIKDAFNCLYCCTESLLVHQWLGI